ASGTEPKTLARGRCVHSRLRMNAKHPGGAAVEDAERTRAARTPSRWATAQWSALPCSGAASRARSPAHAQFRPIPRRTSVAQALLGAGSRKENAMLASKNPASTHPSDLAARMMPTVHRVARKLARRLPQHIRVDDLVGAGCQGLVDAIARFDVARSEKFESYAELRIRGAMLDELRAHDPLSRDQRAAAKRIATATRVLGARLGRAPGADEVAAEMGISLRAYWDMLATSATAASTPIEDDEDTAVAVRDTHAEPADDLLCRKQLADAVTRAVGELPPRLQRVLELHYVEGLTLKQIGEVFGVTESRACQLCGDAIKRLRALCVEQDAATEPTSAEPPASRRRGRPVPALAMAA